MAVMRKNVHGSTNLYGYAVGILMIEGYFPRLPGAIGNATTFSFPVLHRVVPGAPGDRVVRELSGIEPEDAVYRAFIDPWIDGARALEGEGVRAITTSCGFAATFQNELTEAVDVPVFATSLLLVPVIARMLKASERVGIVTADSRYLSRRHYEGAGIDPDRVALAGMEGQPEFEAVVFNDKHELDVARMEAELLDVVDRMVASDPSVKALLLECSLLPPFAGAVQERTGLPVFDFTTMVHMVQAALVREPFRGYM